MKIYYSETHRRHTPKFELFDGGVRMPYFESPERMDRILDALKKTNWAEIFAPQDFGLDPIHAVHEADYIEFIRNGYAEWINTRPEVDAGKEDKSTLMPATFPPRGWRRKTASLLGRAGYFTMDLSAPIVAGTWEAAYASAQCALSGANAIVQGEHAAFALCRPPGHHAGRANCGGYCYINNAAVAAQWLTSQGRVALLDVDYHAGNGTQDIFYESDRVLTISLHADPDYRYPYYAGYADETGSGAGLGYHRNFPLPAGTGDAEYLSALDQACDLIRKFGPKTIVVSAGMDTYAGDPLGDFKVTTNGIRQIGKRIAGLNLPALAVMEGGYNNDALGENIVALLEGLNS
jgi:acetoin utilization deacetylase AcuC-like enzyme